MINLKSETLKSYYGENPFDYDIKFIHYTLNIENECKEEYNLLMQDLNSIKEYTKNSFLIYFSDLENLNKVINNTSIIDEYKEDVYVRIRNQEEYKNYLLLNKNLKLVIELNNLGNISLNTDKIVLQIDNISELSIEQLDKLLEKYNIVGIQLGQIAYITDDYLYLLNVLSDMYGIGSNNQLELEKNNKLTNDLYSIDEYRDIVNKILLVVNKYSEEDTINKFIKIFNFFAEKIYYDEDTTTTKIEDQNLIGPLMNNKCVCEGYSKLLNQVCSIIGIESISVGGGGNKDDGGHIWNQVKIDGVWYNADLTNYSYAIHNNKNKKYCLVSDDELTLKCDTPFKHKCSKNYKL